MGNSVRQSYSFKRILLFYVDSTEREIYWIQDGGIFKNEKSAQRHSSRPIPID